MNYRFAVVGAGPAGIAAVGKLLDCGISPQSILWFDPLFTAGDFGAKWGSVPSNTKVALFLQFFFHCHSFEFAKRLAPFPIESLPASSHCPLKLAADPLCWISEKLCKKVRAIRSSVTALQKTADGWLLQTDTDLYSSFNVILATGSEPKTLSLALDSIPLQTAFDPERLRQAICLSDPIAVFGSSHSAILALANLISAGAKKVYNIYRSPHRYAIYHESWIERDNTGLKGFSAEWAKRHIDEIPHPNLRRFLETDPFAKEALASCTKAIYAIGFSPRNQLYPAGIYNPENGKIDEGLYGVGIAFPERQFCRNGEIEYRVGLWKFMEYLDRIIPAMLIPENNRRLASLES